MNDKTLEELLDCWREETFTTKEAIDQLLRHLILVHERVRALERRQPASPPPAPSQPAARAGRAGAKRR